MNLSEFQDKDVISIKTGKKIGNIIDCKIDPTDGKIISFVLDYAKGIFAFRNSSKIEISFDKINKIGEDVILIDYCD